MNKKLTFLQKIFSITKNEQKTHKIVCILGIKIKVAQKSKKVSNLENTIFILLLINFLY